MGNNRESPLEAAIGLAICIAITVAIFHFGMKTL